MKIGFIGLGNMGAPMARNLLNHGHALQAFDLNDAALRDLAERGATACASPKAAATDVELVVTMLPAADAWVCAECEDAGVEPDEA